MSLCVFSNHLQILVNCIEIILFIYHYFLVCIFKYRTILRKFHWYLIIILGYKCSGTIFVTQSLLYHQQQQNRTASTTTEEGSCVWFVNSTFTMSVASGLLFGGLPSVIYFYCYCLDTWFMNIYQRNNNTTSQKQKQHHRLGVFDSLNPLLWWVSPSYICSDFALLALCYIVLLLLFWYMIYEFLSKHKQQHNR